MNTSAKSPAQFDQCAPPGHGRSWWRYARWLHLVWLVIPAFQPMFDPDPGWTGWSLYGGMLLVFLPLYVLDVTRPGNSRARFSIPITVLGAVLTPFNTGMAVLFVYVAAAVGVTEQRSVALRAYGGLTLLIAAFTVVSTVPMPWRIWPLLPNVLLIWVIGLIQLEAAERERDAADLRVRNAHIEHLATMAERERIARDLHDLLGHSLTAMIVRAQLVQRLTAAEPQRAAGEAVEIESTAREALSEVRKAVRGWRLATLEAELESARGMLSSVDVELTVRRDAELMLVGSAEHELALAVREALTNVARHAGATSAHVRIGTSGEDLRLVVADDGVGGTAAEGDGLRGVRERLSALGGWVSRDGSAGTTVTVSLPRQVAT